MTQQTREQVAVVTNGRTGRAGKAEFGSDVVVELLRELGIQNVALNPGASYRGLHDSIVNFEGRESPQIILCAHEEIAVAIAGGYARVTGRPMAVALHNVVGLQHASMGIFCAYCDRSPMIILGGTGPMDTTKRRPHIDWVHTALVQGNDIRDYVKWDDQPYAVGAIPESLLRAHRIATTEPCGPVYLCYDTELQEQPVAEAPVVPDVSRFAPPRPPAANPEALKQAATLLVQARWPVIIADGAGRHHEALTPLRELAETLGCAVVDRGEYFNFPSTHPLDLTLAEGQAVEDADVWLVLDAGDIGGAQSGVKDRDTLSSTLQARATIIHITLGDLLQSKWAGDYERLHPVDVPIAANSAEALPALLAVCRSEIAADSSAGSRIEDRRRRVQEIHDSTRDRILERLKPDWDLRPISSYRLYSELWGAVKSGPWSLASAAGRAPVRALWEFTEPEQRANVGRGAGIGYSEGGALGAALAFRETNRICVAVCGDGSFLMVPQALWTAANSELPILYVIFNNRSYFNDEGHQEYIARLRGRPVENKDIGIRISSPDADFAALARSLGVQGFGPVTDPAELGTVLQQAVRVVREQRKPALVDVVTQPR
jgi:thiamine pyrophosphate-dependent acetolactate synthase large subunit-like protein